MTFVTVTMIINALKMIDLVLVMTKGAPRGATRIIGYTVFWETFNNNRTGYGSAVAVILLLMVIPFIIFSCGMSAAIYEHAQGLTMQKRRPSLTETLITLTRRGPIHAILVIIGIIWLVPSVGLAVTSFRTRGDISASGWWTVASGNRTITPKLLELNIIANGESSDNTIVAGESLTGELLADAVKGVPDATIRLVRVQRIRGTSRSRKSTSPSR